MTYVPDNAQFKKNAIKSVKINFLDLRRHFDRLLYHISKEHMNLNITSEVALPGTMLTTGLNLPVSLRASPDNDFNLFLERRLHRNTTFILCFHLRRA